MIRTALLAVFVFIAGCSVPADGQNTAPTAPGWSVPSSPSATGSAADLDANQVLEAIRKEGYSPYPPEVPKTGPLRAIDSVCSGSANGRCHRVFVFDGPTRVGSVDAGLVEIIRQDGEEVVLEFPQYKVGDPGCCPSGERRKHTGRMVDGALAFSPPIPADPNNPGAR